jgi:cell division transport system permease protein
MRVGFMLGEVWNGLRRNMSMAISVILVTMVSMFLLGLGLLAQRQADTWKGYWYDRVQVSIYLCNSEAAQPNCQNQAATAEQKATIKSQLDKMPEVKEVFYESQEDAFARFKDQFKNSPVASNALKVGDIPDSYRVQLKDPSKFAVVTSAFDGAPGVASVQDQEKVLKPLLRIINFITGFAIFMAAIMVLCAVLLIMTTVRQVAYARRREIGIMRLVGASNFTIRTPFIVETVLSGLIGVALAVGMLFATTHLIFNRVLSTLFFDRGKIGNADVWLVTPWLAVVVVFVAVSTSMLTLWRYLRI